MDWTIKRWDEFAPNAELSGTQHDYVHAEVVDGELRLERDVDGWGSVTTYVPRAILEQLFAEHDAYLARAAAGSKGDQDA